MLISLIIATYNRSNEVFKLTSQLNDQFENLGADDIELIFIDNNSSDDTAQKAKSIDQKLTIQYFLETKQGSSEARNRGIKEAQGKFLVFLDDDIYLADDFLQETYNLVQNHKSQVELCFAARVIPDWELDPLPKWLNLKPPYEIIQSCFPSHDYGDQELVYPFDFYKRKVQNPISACFLVSREIFAKYGDFREDLGIKADKRGACEDTEFFWRIIKDGVVVKYQPKLCVYHPISDKRIDKDFVLAWYELVGETMEYMKANNLTHLSPDAKCHSIFTLEAKLIIYKLAKVLSLVFLDEKKSFWFECQIAYTQGQMQYLKPSLGV